MNAKIRKPIVAAAGVILIIAGLTNCRDLFKDPLADKKTGDKVTILLLDRNFIKTKLEIRLEDNATGEAINQEQVEVRFIGPKASNLISFGGNKSTSYNTSSGFIEVGYDPNIVINSQNPLEMTLIALSLHYASAPQLLSYTTEGTKNLVIRMIHKPIGKSLSTGPYGEPFDISYNGVLHSAQLEFLADISTSPTGTAWKYINMYSPAANGFLLCDNLTDPIVYEDFGAYYFGVSSGLNLLPPALPTKYVGLETGDLVYSTVLKSGTEKCPQGLTIHTDRADGNPGTGVFDYLITFSDGTTSDGQVTCTFPSGTLIEPLYYPGSSSAVTVRLFGDAQYDMSAPVNLASPCGARADFSATPKINLKSYKFITRYGCPDNSFGMGLSIIGEFRKNGTDDTWTSFEFVEGICELLLVANADYDFRVNIDGEYYAYTLPTDPAKVEAALVDSQSDDYRLKNLVITTTSTLVTIDAEVELSQVVCDKIQ